MNQIQFKAFFLLINLLYLAPINSQNDFNVQNKRVYNTKEISNKNAPKIDGSIDEDSWDIVEWESDFIEWQPNENTAPTHQTKFKIIYDKENLYIAVKAFDDNPENIEKRLSRRDESDGDFIEIHIDSYHDLRTGFSFSVNAAGVKKDEFISNNGENWDKSWNPIWHVKTKINIDGWTAEMKIPLSQLRFGNDVNQIWGLQILRNYFDGAETSLWQRIPPKSPGWISEMGELHGLRNLNTKKQIEIQPYFVSQYESAINENNNPFSKSNQFKLNGGIDAKIGITNDLTLDITINPDFGQVEADPSAVVLDGFQVFFREQRPFFVENNNIFNYRFGTGNDLVFYSRRIGRNPQGNPELSSNEFIDKPQRTKILGAAKFSGKTKNGWSFGVLESLTSNEYAQVGNNLSRRKEKVEPLTNYFVGRVQKDFNNKNTFIGGILTGVNRINLGSLSNSLREAGYSGGVDFKHQWNNRSNFVGVYIVGSHVKGSAESITKTQQSLTHLFQRVDADHLKVDNQRKSLTGTAGKIQFGKTGGSNWRYNLGYVWRSPELELNDIGFLNQADKNTQFANVSYQIPKPFGKFRRVTFKLAQFSVHDFQGNINLLQYDFDVKSIFKNNWKLGINVGDKPINFSNTLLMGGPRWRFSQESYVNSFIASDDRKKLALSSSVGYSWSKQANLTTAFFQSGITFRPTNALQTSLSVTYTNYSNKTQFVNISDYLGTPRYIISDISNKSISAQLRLNYTLNPNLSIQYYAQPFFAKGNYSNFKYVTNPVAKNLYDRFEPYSNNQINYDETNDRYLVDENSDGNIDYTFGNSNFSIPEFRSNLVVRWEYLPGSELYLVWSQGISSNVSNQNKSLLQNVTSIFDYPSENIFLIKATYRFSL